MSQHTAACAQKKRQRRAVEIYGVVGQIWQLKDKLELIKWQGNEQDTKKTVGQETHTKQ